MTAKRKRPLTRWRFKAAYQGNTHIRIGRVYNAPNVPADIIRWQVVSQSKGGTHDFACTVDEAIAFIAGLSGVLADEMLPKSDKLRRMFR